MLALASKLLLVTSSSVENWLMRKYVYFASNKNESDDLVPEDARNFCYICFYTTISCATEVHCACAHQNTHSGGAVTIL